MKARLSEPVALADAPNVARKEKVSVVIPCYNEERFIAKVLNNLADQYETEDYELIIVDGMSDDNTRDAIATFCRQRPELEVRVIDNPIRNIPTALNLGIAAACGDIIARMDAHAVAPPGYIKRCVEVLRKSGDCVVGMPCRVCPGDDTLVAQAIAMAVSHPFGIGDAKYRLREGSLPQEAVDTVAFGVFRKQLWADVSGFNEELLTNEDYDFNYRVRLRGRLVLLDRSDHCDYFARKTLRELAAQYSRYGSWKARMVLLHPRSIKLRHLVAPLFVSSILGLGLMGIWLRAAWWLLTLEVVTYLLLSLVFAIQIARKVHSGPRLVLWMPAVFFTIHWTWGGSFLLGMIRPPR
jgi:succinoglycan biosynthesis protein ExoA